MLLCSWSRCRSSFLDATTKKIKGIQRIGKNTNNNWCTYLYGEYNTNKFVILGDFNIAPTDNDVPDPKSCKDQILCSDNERQSLKKLTDLGLLDLFNKFDFPEKTYTWWDYRAGCFHRNIGYRIDLILATQAIADNCSDYVIDKDTRHKSWCPEEPRTSDHAPVRIII